jgi:hypothetical protein
MTVSREFPLGLQQQPARGAQHPPATTGSARGLA